MIDHHAVIADELVELRKRQRTIGQPPAGEDPLSPEHDELVGLAISGGGIRSATFALGVLEGLKQLGLLKKMHYLSTVSGGGYIGAWLSANCLRHKDWLERPQSGETMVTYDLTGDASTASEGKQE